jgi:ABC-type nitrate/sulfonate/bicarbonate transport system permease component
MADASTTSPAASGVPPAAPKRRSFFALRREVPRWQAYLFGALCILFCYGLWWYVTRENEEGDRILNHFALPSPSETFAEFPSLWFDRALTLNTLASLERVALGFALGAAVGVPLGVFCGCFPWVNSFLAPITIFGRNIPLAALIPLTFALFGIGEQQKIMFIFVASVAFIVIDTATAVINVSDRYIDTAYTLGASRRQIVVKVLFPLALPSIFDSLRLLFGLAFGYIMLAELVQEAHGYPGLGGIISTSQRQGPREHITLILLIIPVVALLIDRGLYWVQRQLFPYRYGGSGFLHQAVRAALRTWEDFSSFFRRSRRAPRPGFGPQTSASGGKLPPGSSR